MNSTIAAIVLFAAYAISTQWAFRCQRVGRGILLVAKDSAAQHRELHSAIMPTSYVTVMWIGRLLWLTSAFFAWQAWGWLGVLGIVLYVVGLGALVDAISPWPSYTPLLQRIKRRILSGSAGLEALFLLPTIDAIEEAVAAGVHFEKATFSAWLGRAADSAETMAKADLESGDQAPD